MTDELKYYSDSVPAIIAPAYTGDAGCFPVLTAHAF